MKIIAHCDGAANSNPGPAGAGVHLFCPENNGIMTISWPIGVQSNNVAEYQAVIMALLMGRALGADEMEILTDSETLVEQIRGGYLVRAPHLRPLHERAIRLIARFPHGVHVEWVPRDQNTKANDLAGGAAGANPDYNRLKRERGQRWEHELSAASPGPQGRNHVN